MNDLRTFVEERLGSDVWSQMERIRLGGDNNHKGRVYEVNFAVYKIAEAHSKDESDTTKISSQVTALVDDLCVWREDGKVNYQIKNSSLTAADWTPKIEERFVAQQRVDLEFFQVPDAKQVLLVSCKDKKAANDDKIPEDLKSFCECHFFPYFEKLEQLLWGHQPAKDVMRKICNEGDLSDYLVALKCIKAAWLEAESEGDVSVHEIVATAKEMSRPNVFREEQQSVPDWLNRLVAPFERDGVSIASMSGDFIVDIGRMSVRIPSGQALYEVEDALLGRKITSKVNLVEVLMELSSKLGL